MTTLYTNLSLYITFTMIYYIRQEYFVKVSHHYITSDLFIAIAMWTHWLVLIEKNVRKHKSNNVMFTFSFVLR